jgi:hypothetical protein
MWRDKCGKGLKTFSGRLIIQKLKLPLYHQNFTWEVGIVCGGLGKIHYGVCQDHFMWHQNSQGWGTLRISLALVQVLSLGLFF